jgi:hypothetical protein
MNLALLCLGFFPNIDAMWIGGVDTLSDAIRDFQAAEVKKISIKKKIDLVCAALSAFFVDGGWPEANAQLAHLSAMLKCPLPEKYCFEKDLWNYLKYCTGRARRYVQCMQSSDKTGSFPEAEVACPPSSAVWDAAAVASSVMSYSEYLTTREDA